MSLLSSIKPSPTPRDTDLDAEETFINKTKVVLARQKRRRMWLAEAGNRRIQNGMKLTLAHSFGLNPKPVDRYFAFVEDDSGFGIRAGNNLIYSTPQHVLCHNIDSKTQTAIEYERRGEVTFLSNYKYRDDIIILMAETSPRDFPSVLQLKHSMHKLTRLPHLHLPLGAIIRYAVITKIELKNKKLCYSLCWRPSVVSIWRMDKQVLVVSHDVGCLQPHMAIDPTEPCRFFVAGGHYLRAWDVNVLDRSVEEDKSHLLPLKHEKEEFFLDLAFIPGTGKLLLLCSGNRVFIIEHGQVLRIMQNIMSGSKLEIEDEENESQSPSMSMHQIENPSEPSEACKLLVTRKNLVFGGSEGSIALYYFDPENYPAFLSTFRLDSTSGPVLSLSFSIDDHWLAVACQLTPEIDPSQLLKRSRTMDPDEWGDRKIEGFLVNIRKLESENTNFISRLFPISMHYGELIGAAEAISRHQIVSVGEDMNLKVWKYSKTWQGAASIQLTDAPTAISFHPVGFQVAVGSRDSLKLFAILENDVVITVEKSVKTCRAVSYSPHGEFLAFSSGSLIFVMSPYTSALLASFYGHSTIIQSLVWTQKNGQLVSCCNGGTVCVWTMPDLEPKTFSHRQFKLKSAAYDDILEDLVLLTQDGLVLIMNGDQIRVDLSHSGEVRFTSMLLRKDLSLLFLGTTKGTVQVRLWPVLADEDLAEYQVHQQAITGLELSIAHDELITISSDHCLCISKATLIDCGQPTSIADYLAVTDQSRKHLQLISTVEYLSFNSLSLVRESYVQEQIDKIQELEDTISTVQSKFKYTSETAEKHYQDALSHMKSDNDRLQELQRSEISELRRKLDMEKTEKTQTISSLKADYELQIITEIRKAEQREEEQQEKYDQLSDEMEELKLEYARQLQEVASAHEQVRVAIQYDAGAKIERVKADYDDMIRSVQKQGEIYEIGLTQNENEYEYELVNERQKLMQQIEGMEEQLRTLQTVNKRLSNEREQLTQRDEERKREMATLEEERNGLKKEVEDLRSSLTRTQEQMQEREEVIKKKETTIKELRAFNIHLQNFRYVLDEKIKELKDDRGPLGLQLNNLQDQIRNMYQELLDEYEKTERHSKLTKELRGQTKELTKANERLKNEVFVAKRKLSLMQGDLAQLIRYTNKDTVLPEMQKLMEKHMPLDDLYAAPEVETKEGPENVVEASDLNKVKSELLYQHDLVREQLTAAQKKSKAHEQKTEQELRLKMKENASLIDECNKLRVQLNEMKRNNAILRDKNNQLQSQNRDATAESRYPRPVLERKNSSAETVKADLKGQIYKPVQDMKRTRTTAVPMRIGKIMTELEKNQKEILEQNLQFQKLQDQVSIFLYKPMSSGSRLPGKIEGEEEQRRGFASPGTGVGSILSTRRSNPVLPKLTSSDAFGEKSIE